MGLLRWIWAYLFDCVHSHTTWPHQNQFGLAYVSCLDCGREMPYSLEYMQIVGQDRKRNTWEFRSSATASLIIAGTLLFLTPSYALGQTAHSLADQRQPAGENDNIKSTLVIGFVGGFVHKDDIRHSEVQLARSLQQRYCGRAKIEVFTNRQREQARLATLEWVNRVGPFSDEALQPQISYCSAIAGALQPLSILLEN